MSLTYQELIDTIESNPSGVREALELVKRQLSAYPSATSADDGDTLALSKDDGSGTTQALSIATLLLRAVENKGGVKSLEAGVIADRTSASTAGADAFFLSTDEPRLYRSTGSVWEVVLSTSIDTLADLQAADTNGARSVYMLGRTSAGDGGEGHFRWDSSDLSTEVGNDEVTAGEGDGGIYVAPDSDKTGASGAWVRQFGESAFVDWWGRDTAGVQAAIDWVSAHADLTELHARGSYSLDRIVLKSDVEFTGPAKLTLASVDEALIEVSSAHRSAIKYFELDGANLSDGAGSTNEASVVHEFAGSTSDDLIIAENRFLNIPTNDGQRYHSTLVQGGSVTVRDNYTDGCGGDIYNFNGGTHAAINNTGKNGGDGGVAFNNEASGEIAWNYLYKCDLGVGSGPHGETSDPYHSLSILGNKIEACGDGINMGFFSFAGRTGPINVAVANNRILRCKRSGIRYDGEGSLNERSLSLSGNIVFESGTADYDGSTGTGMGIVVTQIKEVAITGNIAVACDGSGFFIDNVEIGSFTGNTSSTNGIGVELQGSYDLDIFGNKVESNVTNWSGLDASKVDASYAVDSDYMNLGNQVFVAYKTLEGTLSSGTASVAHGLTSNRIISISAYYEKSTNVGGPLDFDFDNTNVNVSGGSGSEAFKVVVWYAYTDVGW